MADAEMPLVEHLRELRTRLLRAVASILVVFIMLAPFADPLYQMLSKPLLAHFPADAKLIATDVAAPFFAPFKLTLVAAFFLALPFVFYELWRFVAPGLYRHERKLIAPLLVSSVLLFYLGVAFAYFVVFPLVFAFFTQTAPEGVTVMTDISSYLDFTLKLFFAFGLAFEIPIATVLLIWSGITSVESLRNKRPYVIVGAFAIGMFLTPPDAISQTLLAVPMWLLFELGVWLGRWVKQGKGGHEEYEGD
ncbi:MAG: twin-arginine translocase subunit TatC [Gammaproteobacteria bacterium]|nr:MAG: twin-arginine translocase subunit TatC [Gammaproteobacteria bacterium]